MPSPIGPASVSQPTLEPDSLWVWGLEACVLSMAQCVEPHPSKHWSWVETQAGREADPGPLLGSLGLQGGSLQLLVCGGQGECSCLFQDLVQIQKAVPTAPLAVSYFPKGFANIKEQKGNKYRGHSKCKKTGHKEWFVDLP